MAKVNKQIKKTKKNSVTIKLPEKTARQIEMFAKLHSNTFNKMLKEIIEIGVAEHNLKLTENNTILYNQMKLFPEDEIYLKKGEKPINF
ncbi:MAG: hypothetical protein LBR36_08080 [Bacteroidales bacterium]|jgi:L-rhamnose mutarotase|nr:hypothetical protein [Bacteroidales bacterium]